MANKNVLVVEDETAISTSILLRLKKQGVEAVLAGNGKDAIDMVLARKEPFDGIWLDFDVPGYNGLEFMRHLRKIKGQQDVPVLIVSNTAAPEHVQQTIELGAKKWILKAEARFDDVIKEFIAIINQAKEKGKE